MGCEFCGAVIDPPERATVYAHCTRADCVGAWRRRRIETGDLALVLVPKQGMTWVTKAEVASNTKSSGR